MNKKWFAALAACALVLFAAGCSNGSDGSGGTEPEPVAVDSIDVSKKKLPLEVGVMEKLDVRILPAEAAGVTVQWSSSKETVATVGNDGTVKAIKVGTAIITAQAGDKTDTCEVTVSTHSHYYENWKCRTCGLDKPSFKEGDIDDWGNLTAYTGSGTTVEIPKGVTCIGSEVFKDCTSLTGVTIPDGMTRIGDSAFQGCTGLASVTIPDGVTSIAYEAFEDCSNLASVTIPDSVTSIGSNAFSGCTSLKEIRFTGTMEEWKAINGSDGVNIQCIRCSDGNVGVEEVPAYLKMDGRIVTGYTDGVPADLTIPDGVTIIAYEAFKGCKSLTSVTIPDSVTSIGSNAFYECTSLIVNYDGTKEQWEKIGGNGKADVPRVICTDGYIGVEDVPAYLKFYGTEVWGNTDELPADLIIPNGVTVIGNNAFSGCSSLTTVTIPDSVTEIGQSGFSAFDGCSNLETVRFSGTLAQWCVIDNDWYIHYYAKHIIIGDGTDLKTITELVIPDGVTKIGDEAFYSCSKLTSVTIPDSVTEIGQHAFSESNKITDVTYKGTKTQWEVITKYYSYGLRYNKISGKDGTTWDAGK